MQARRVIVGSAFALRWVPYERIAEVLARYGLTTEQLSGHTFRQRRFADDTERDYVLGKLRTWVSTPLEGDRGLVSLEFLVLLPRRAQSPVPARTAAHGVTPLSTARES
jgi:hypothetical protein